MCGARQCAPASKVFSYWCALKGNSLPRRSVTRLQSAHPIPSKVVRRRTIVLMAASLSKRQRCVLWSLLFLIAAIVLGVSVFFATRGSTEELEREPLTPLGQVPILPDYPFDVNENLKVCNMRRVAIKIDNSTLDYSAEISRAIKDLGRRGGGTLAFEQGTYLVSKPILLPSNICIRGAGMLRTSLRMATQSSPYPHAGMIRMIKAQRISILDVTIDGAKDSQSSFTSEDRYGRYGVYGELIDFVWMRNVRAVNHRDYGFDPHGNRTNWSSFLLIEGCVADDNGKDGFTFDQTRSITLLNSSARRNGRHGVNVVTGSEQVVIKNVVVSHNGAQKPEQEGCGIIVQNNEPSLQTKDILIENSTVTESPRGGVCISGSINVTVTNVNATVSMFERTPCFLLRQSKAIKFRDAHCTARSGRRMSAIDSVFSDNNKNQVKLWIPKVPGVYNTAYGYVPTRDPVCRHGKPFKNVCCPLECEVCGDVNCGKGRYANTGKRCCISGIKSLKRSCSKFNPPCVISRKYLPAPEVFIDYIIAKKIPKSSFPRESNQSSRRPIKNISAIPPPFKPNHQVKESDEGRRVKVMDEMVIDVPVNNKDASNKKPSKNETDKSNQDHDPEAMKDDDDERKGNNKDRHAVASRTGVPKNEKSSASFDSSIEGASSFSKARITSKVPKPSLTASPTVTPTVVSMQSVDSKEFGKRQTNGRVSPPSTVVTASGKATASVSGTLGEKHGSEAKKKMETETDPATKSST